MSLVGLRLFSVISQAFAVVMTGFMARELGGGRLAQVAAALAVALSPLPLFEGTEFQYTTFDYLWWVLIAYFVIRLLKTENPRWWLAIGATLGVGFLTKYTMGFYLCGILGGVLLTRARRYLASGWFWGGMALGFAICLPNLVWQVQHGFYLAAFSAAHSYARCGRGTGRWISEPAILVVHEPDDVAAVDCRAGGLFAGAALSHAGMDVFDPAGAVHGREGAWVLPGGGVSHADGDGRRGGRALGCVVVKDVAAGGSGGGILHWGSGDMDW